MAGDDRAGSAKLDLMSAEALLADLDYREEHTLESGGGHYLDFLQGVAGERYGDHALTGRVEVHVEDFGVPVPPGTSRYVVLCKECGAFAVRTTSFGADHPPAAEVAALFRGAYPGSCEEAGRIVEVAGVMES